MNTSPASPSLMEKLSGWLTNSLRTRLTVSLVLTAGVTVLVVAYFGFNRTRNVATFLNNTLQTAVAEQTQQQLTDITSAEARIADQFLQTAATNATTLSNYATALLLQENIFSQGTYWDARQKLTQLPEGQWDNPNEDAAWVYGNSDFQLTEQAIVDLNTLAHLDFVAPGILRINPNIVALYYIQPEGSVVYYPNVDLSSDIGDTDPRSGIYYTDVLPENNPQGIPVWTAPYQDPALSGLLISHSTPLYDQVGNFRGMIAADVQLATITEQIIKIQVAETGYAFLIDEAGRLIGMPDAGYQDFGLQVEEVPINETPKQTILNTGSTAFQNITNRMVAGETGLATIEIKGVERYLAYTPLPSVGFSLGVIVPVAEMNALALSAREKMNNEINALQWQSSVLVFLVLLLAAAVSLWLARTLTAPIETLQQTAQQIAKGNLDVKAEVGTYDEIGMLAQTFNQMTNQLQETFGRLERRNKAIETSADVSRHISTILDPEQLLTEVTEQIQKTFKYYSVQIYLLDALKQNLMLTSGTGEAGRLLLAAGHKIPAGDGATWQAVTSNKTTLLADVTQDQNRAFEPLLPNTQTEIFVPIAIGEQVLGVLAVQHDEPGGLRQLDADLLQLVASQVATALQNARAYEQIQRKAEQEALINSINQRIENATTIEGVLDIAARELRRTLGAQRTVVELGQGPGNGQNGAK